MNLSDVWPLIFQEFGLLFLLMGIAAFLSRHWKNAGVVDIVWAGGFLLLALMDALFASGDVLHRLIFFLMVGLANGRLAWHLLSRFRHEFPQEDKRYHQMREQWDRDKKPTDWLFFGVFLLQGFLMLVVSLPFILVCFNTSRTITVLDWSALAIWFIAWIGEAIADTQLQQFKAKPENKGKICQAGLWQCSRHPNYFFEWLLWCAYCLFALSAPYGWVGICAPVLMLFFLVFVTGVAASETQSLKSKGEEYRRYQESTSAFVPWFKLKKV